MLHGLSLLGLILYPLPGWGVAGVAYLLFWLGGLGTTVAYHRALAHRSLKLKRVVEFPLVLFAFLNGSGSPATWTANHRFHHANADGPNDISSPRRGGFWWAHLRWLWQAAQSPIGRWAPDLDTPYWRFFTRWQVFLLALSLCAGLPFGWAAFFWLGPIRLCASLHAQCFANSAAHLGGTGEEGVDSSKNVPWLAPVQALQGENWHRNHHQNPASARLGRTWMQVDLGWWTILLFEKLGLATDVRRPVR